MEPKKIEIVDVRCEELFEEDLNKYSIKEAIDWSRERESQVESNYVGILLQKNEDFVLIAKVWHTDASGRVLEVEGLVRIPRKKIKVIAYLRHGDAD